MQKKENTPIRIARRNYEEKHKQERKEASRVFGTSLPTKDYQEITEFLSTYHITKVGLIYAGYAALKEQIIKKE